MRSAPSSFVMTVLHAGQRRASCHSSQSSQYASAMLHAPTGETYWHAGHVHVERGPTAAHPSRSRSAMTAEHTPARAPAK
jgi:hypothetical protein